MHYVTFSKFGRKLRITLTSEGKDELHSRVDAGDDIGNDTTLYDVLETHLSNGWEWIRPDEIGALTPAPLLSDNCARDDQGILTQIASVYWYGSDQLRSPVEEMLANSYVDFERVY